MSDSGQSAIESQTPAELTLDRPQKSGKWKPVLTLLVLAPAIGELLSGSSPPLQFFNPISFLLLVGLYGCGALLVRETVAARRLTVVGLLLLGAAYGIVEEGLMCKSFFNPHWTDTGYLSIYGRAGGVNWVWTFGLTFYHMVVSIAVPIFLTEALFPKLAFERWLRRRGTIIASLSLTLVVLLGFAVFDNRQFHLIELKSPLTLAERLSRAQTPLTGFISSQLTPKHRELFRKAVESHADTPDLRHGLVDELNRLLPRADLYSPERFPADKNAQAQLGKVARPPHGDKLVVFNRGLLEQAFPDAVEPRVIYPYRPPWVLTMGSVAMITGLVLVAFKQNSRTVAPRQEKPVDEIPSSSSVENLSAESGGSTQQDGEPFLKRPWLTGLLFCLGFVLLGFILPSLVEHGARIPALLDCGLWVVVALALGRILRQADTAPDRIWRRGLWAIGVLTPWVVFAMILGIFVGMIGAKSFSGMPFISVAFGTGFLLLALRWRRRLDGP